MKTILLFLLGIGVFILFFVSFLIGSYNSLVQQKIEAQTQQAQIETQLQRRFDLVPNLVSSVKGAMAQEREVFEAIADARTKYAGVSSGTPEKLEAATRYESALGRLLLIMENYPQLLSIEAVRDLMVQLEGTENRISVARQRYNEAVQKYNSSTRVFPKNIIASVFGFKELPFYKGVEKSEQAPTVDFNMK